MIAQIKKLERGTQFKYEGKTYELGYKVWNSSVCSNYLGPKENSIRLEECYPKLGGKFQTNLPVWFNENTEVTLDE